MKQEFEGFDFTNFWDDNYYARKEYISDAPTDELIADVEKELGYKLPASYIWLMKQHNGGIPFNTCFPTDSPTNWACHHHYRYPSRKSVRKGNAGLQTCSRKDA